MIIRGTPPRSREHLLNQELLFAIERTRSRLAVAIAAESRFLSRQLRQQYLEIEDRMRRCVREIRRSHSQGFLQLTGCTAALAVLNQPVPVDDANGGEAYVLCERLRKVLKIVEAKQEEP